MNKNAGIIRYFIPRIRDVIFVSTFIGVILNGPRTLNIDGDLGRHLTIGNFIIQNHVIPTHDIFSHTMAGQPLTPHEWLAQVLYAVSNFGLGLDGVILLEALVIASTFVIVFLDTLKRSNSFLIAAVITLWAAAASSIHWIARPHIFTFLLLALWTPIVRRIANGDSKLFWAPPLIMLVWANTHGAFISGFVVLACYLAGWVYERYCSQEKPSPKILKNLLIISTTSFVATLFNPVGWDLWSTSIGYVQNDYLVSHTQEYFSPNFHLSGTWPFLALVSFSIFLLSRSLNKLSVSEGLLLAGWTAMSLFSARNIPLYAIISAPIIGNYLSNTPNRFSVTTRIEINIHAIENQIKGYLMPLGVILVTATLFYKGIPLDTQRKGNQFDTSSFPVEAASWLEQNPQSGDMFNYFPWGGYLLYRLWPSERVFIDGQTDFYGEELTREYASAISADGHWREVVSKYHINWVIIPPDIPLFEELVRAGWETLYTDHTAIIFHKP
jgi:hypothetical protein